MMLALALLMAQPPASPPIEPDYEELVVTAERRTLAPLPEPIEQFRQHCFETTRRERRPILPLEPPSEWTALEEYERESLRLGPEVEAVSLSDPGRSQRLVLTAETRQMPGRLIEHRCSLIVIGGRDHGSFQNGMARLFGGSGTSRHLGHPAGLEPIPGWSHLIWTAMPQRGSRSWWTPRGRQSDSFLTVTDLSFYDSFDFLLGDLKRTEKRRTDVSILSLVLTYRPRR